MKVFIVLVGILCIGCIEYASTLDFIIEKIEVTHQTPEHVTVDADISKVDDKNAVNVNFTMQSDAPPSMEIIITASAFYNNDYHVIPFKFRRNMCTLLQNEFKYVKDDIMKNSNVPTECPIKKGSYYIHDFVVNADKLSAFGVKAATIPWDRLKGKIEYVADDVKLCGMEVLIKVINDKKFG